MSHDTFVSKRSNQMYEADAKQDLMSYMAFSTNQNAFSIIGAKLISSSFYSFIQFQVSFFSIHNNNNNKHSIFVCTNNKNLAHKY